MSPVPFSFFISLLREISKAKPHSRKPRQAREILLRWLQKLRQENDPIPRGTFLALIRLLFPERDSRRKFHFQETSLVPAIAKCLRIEKTLLDSWNDAESGEQGCLGLKIQEVLERTSSSSEGHLSMIDVDNLLSELASKSAYSHSSFRFSKNSDANASITRLDILKQLYRPLSPIDACFLTQIILKDLRPVLYPRHLASSSSTAILSVAKSKLQIEPLDITNFLWAWDPSGKLARSSHVQSSLEDIAECYESSRMPGNPTLPLTIGPTVGSPIEIPKCREGEGCNKSLSTYFAKSARVWAETKYDGERCQIHVQLRVDGSPKITIYSKSQRDSTSDRHSVHDTIRDLLHLNSDQISSSQVEKKIQQNVVLEAEMVAYHKETGLEEFWRIRRMIEATAKGPRSWKYRKERSHANNVQDSEDDRPISSNSLQSNVSDSNERYLILVFFDVLILDSVSLLSQPYTQRRQTLEKLVNSHLHVEPRRVMLAERQAIDLSKGLNYAQDKLRRVFAKGIASFEEGIVLKADESRYNHHKDAPWVKLKKDYIPGYGDCIDLVALGASWDKERGRILNVHPGIWTTLHIGALANASEVEADPSIKPSFHIYFCVSWGLTREQLEDMNFRINHADPVKFQDKNELHRLHYNFDLFKGMPEPTVLFRKPLVAELYGGGFTKEPGSRHYYPRFPRLTKLHRESERSWKDTPSLEELYTIARKAVGRDRSSKDIEDWGKTLFGKANLISPKVKSSDEVAKREKEWLRKLEISDGIKEDIRRVGTGWLQTREGVRRKVEIDSQDASVDHSSKEYSSEVASFSNPSPGESTPRASGCQPIYAPPQQSPLSARTNIGKQSMSEPLITPQDKQPPPVWPLVPTVPPLPTPIHSPRKRKGQPPSMAMVTRDDPCDTITPKSLSCRDTPPRESVASQFDPGTIQPVAGSSKRDVPGDSHKPADTKVENTQAKTNNLSSVDRIQAKILLIPPHLDISSIAWPFLSVLLSGSFLWASPSLPRNLYRPYFHFTSYHRRIYSLNAFLIGCGWGEASGPEWVERGVIFVDSDVTKNEVLECVRAIHNPAGKMRKIWLLLAGILEHAEIMGGTDVGVKDYILGIVE